MPAVNVSVYPSISDIFNLVRVFLNDCQNGGAGTVFTDSCPEAIPSLNDAISRLARRLKITQYPLWTKDVVLLNIPVINSTLGQGVQNPAVWQYMNWSTFNDGLLSYNSPVLPIDLYQPLDVQQRVTGSGWAFTPFPRAQAGLNSLYQWQGLGQWEWRQDGLYWNGSNVNMDIWLRYQVRTSYFLPTLQPSLFPTTYVGIQDSVTALAALVAAIFTWSRGGPEPDADPTANTAIYELRQLDAHRAQEINYSRQPFGDE